LSGRFPWAGAGKPADPNRELSAAQQGISKAKQGTKAVHRRASSRVNRRALRDAIAAIFAAFNQRTDPDDEASGSWNAANPKNGRGKMP
jgi:hypothetical protein